jgi:hypothetical protein
MTNTIRKLFDKAVKIWTMENNRDLAKKDFLSVALPSFQSRVHSVHTTLKTPHKKMSANPRASILYRKSYNMRHPIFASILLLLPTHTQDRSGEFVQKSKTQFLPESKPHAQKLLTQFLGHLPTHHPEIEMNRVIIPSVEKSEIWEKRLKGKNREWHGTTYNERFGTMAGVSRWIALHNSKLSGSRQVQIARHCAKPPPR